MKKVVKKIVDDVIDEVAINGFHIGPVTSQR